MNIRKRIFLVVESNLEITHWKNDKLSTIYDAVMLSAIFMGLLPLMFLQSAPWLVAFDIISCVCFIIDYLLRLITADFKLGKRFGKWAFFIYPFTFMAIIDLLSILPTVSALNQTFKVFRVPRLFKIIRVVKAFRYYEPLYVVCRVLKRERQILLTVLVFAMFYIFVIALIMFNVEAETVINGKPVFANFFEALYWSTCTLTTIGYGDFCPTSTLGRLICMLSALVGLAIIALPSGAITSAYMDEIRKKRNK